MLTRLCYCLLLAPALLACQPTASSTTAKPCIDPAKIRPDAICTMEYMPVCGCDGKTYSNSCVATNAGVTSYTEGQCAN